MAANKKEVKVQDRLQRPINKKSRNKAQQDQVGDALRSIYEQTINEEVPDEFLDILGKLA